MPLFVENPDAFDAALLEDRLARDPADNLARADLAAALSVSGNDESALEVVSEGPSGGPGSSLVLINRFYLGLAKYVREQFARQRARDPQEKIKRMSGQDGPAPRVSVVMPTYNRLDKALPSVRSVLTQSYRDFELVVVNDDGDPAIEQVLASLGSDKIVFVDAVHGGVSSALNVGIHAARGEIIAHLDDDDLHRPGHLQAAVAALDANPEVKAVYTDYVVRVLEPDGGGYRLAGVEPGPGKGWDLLEYKRKSFFPRAAAVVRKEVFAEAGPYPEFMPTREDWETYIRIGERFDWRRVPETTAEYVLKRDDSNLTYYNPEGFIHFANLTGYLHRFHALTGSLWLPPGRADKRTRKVIDSLDRIAAVEPESVRLVYLSKLDLLAVKKPYTFFMEWARHVAASDRFRELEPLILREAARQNPLEPRPWRELLRARR